MYVYTICKWLLRKCRWGGFCSRLPACAPFVRAAATKVIVLPNDLADIMDNSWRHGEPTAEDREKVTTV